MRRTLRMLCCVLAVVPGVMTFAQSPGQDVYKTNCAPCHGATGQADTPAGKKFKVASLNRAEVFHKPDADLIAFVKNGKGDMPAWNDVLSDEEVKSVIAYIHTLEKK